MRDVHNQFAPPQFLLAQFADIIGQAFRHLVKGCCQLAQFTACVRLHLRAVVARF